ncbi:MAG: hypothetical protein WDN69_31340 [Aliidongia sp.]
MAGFDGDPTKPFDVTYAEGAAIGYRRAGAKPLFPFGFGLSYTSFGASFQQAEGGATVTAGISLANTGTQPGFGLAQLYLLSGPSGPETRLLGWRKLALQPGESPDRHRGRRSAAACRIRSGGPWLAHPARCLRHRHRRLGGGDHGSPNRAARRPHSAAVTAQRGRVSGRIVPATAAPAAATKARVRKAAGSPN